MNLTIHLETLCTFNSVERQRWPAAGLLCRVGVRERRADVGLHIETFLAAGDENRRGGGGEKRQTEIEGGKH